MSGGAGRRGLALAAICAALVALPGCGGGDDAAGSASAEREADAAILNDVLSRQLAAIDAQAAVAAGLRGEDRLLALRFRGQEQEHVDAILKTLRGLGAESEPEPEEIDAGELHSRADRLSFLYELEGATMDFQLRAIADLYSGWPRSLLASIVASQAQHRLLLRQRLGLDRKEPVPDAFEDGTDPEAK